MLDTIGKALGLLASIAFMTVAMWYLVSGKYGRATRQEIQLFFALFLLFSGPVAYFWVSSATKFRVRAAGGSLVLVGGYAIAFAIVWFVNWVVATPSPGRPDLVGKWYYNSSTNQGTMVHGGYAMLRAEGDKLVFDGHREYTWTKVGAETDEWKLDSSGLEWHSDSLMFLDSKRFLFRYEVTAGDGSTREGICYGTVMEDGGETWIEGRILTQTNTSNPIGGINTFVRTPKYEANKKMGRAPQIR